MGLAEATAFSSKKEQTKNHQLNIHQFAFLNKNSRKKRILLLIYLINI